MRRTEFLALPYERLVFLVSWSRVNEPESRMGVWCDVARHRVRAGQAHSASRWPEQDRTGHGGFRKDAGAVRRLERPLNAQTQGSAMSRFPTGAATPTSIVDSLKR